MAHETRVRTVTGTIPAADIGHVLPHEHLINDLTLGELAPDATFPELFDRPVTPEIAWILNHRPLASRDNCALDRNEDALAELDAFRRIGGRTVIELTSEGLGQDIGRLKELSTTSGVNIIAGGGWYLERFHPDWARAAGVDRIARHFLDNAYRTRGPDEGGPGVIGEIGISPAITEREIRVLRAACILQREVKLPLFIHLPGFVRLAHDVLDVVLDEEGVPPAAVVLCHMDPSGDDPLYQHSVGQRGVWLEFDMIGMPYRFTLPGEGQSPSVDATITAIGRLIDGGMGGQLLFSHDMFLKSMLRRNGGNGLLFVPGLFRRIVKERLGARIDIWEMNAAHVRRLFETAAHP